MLLSLLNWILVGLFGDVLDLFYLDSWDVFLTCTSKPLRSRKLSDWPFFAGIVVFCGLSNVSSAIFQYRLNTNSLGNALVTNFKVNDHHPLHTFTPLTLH
jgi:hypothetical protein